MSGFKEWWADHVWATNEPRMDTARDAYEAGRREALEEFHGPLNDALAERIEPYLGIAQVNDVLTDLDIVVDSALAEPAGEGES